MTTDEHAGHLSPDLMQSFLDGEASPGETAHVRGHTASCARCRSELDAWRVLFSELGDLGDMAPSPAFRTRVLESLARDVPERLSLAARVARWVRRRAGVGARAATAVPTPVHPGPERLQDLLEGLLPRPEALTVESHLHACDPCRRELEGWRSLVMSLQALPSFAPNAELRERVMAHVRVQIALVAARPSPRERLQLLLGSVSPRTRKGVAALAGAGITPAVTLGMVAWAVFSHPLVTMGSLLSFVWLRGSDLLAATLGGALQRISAGASSLPLQPALDVLGGSLAAAAVAATGLAALTLVAAWVLYRNVLAAPPTDGVYVR